MAVAESDMESDMGGEDTSYTPKTTEIKASEETEQGELEEEEEQEEEEKVKDYETKYKRFNDEQKRENMRLLLGNFSGDQLHRYECYRRSGFQRSTIKKVSHDFSKEPCSKQILIWFWTIEIMQTMLGISVSQTSVIVLAGIAKIFVGEVVEKARDVQEEWGDEGPLKPKHLREAHRRLKRAGVIPNVAKGPKRLFL
jgi:transcription initiation factor TFIID subunit 11